VIKNDREQSSKNDCPKSNKKECGCEPGEWQKVVKKEKRKDERWGGERRIIKGQPPAPAKRSPKLNQIDRNYRKGAGQGPRVAGAISIG